MMCAGFKVAKFREWHEGRLMLLIAQANTCTVCLNEGNGTLFNTEMNCLAEQLFELIEKARKSKVVRSKDASAAAAVPVKVTT